MGFHDTFKCNSCDEFLGTDPQYSFQGEYYCETCRDEMAEDLGIREPNLDEQKRLQAWIEKTIKEAIVSTNFDGIRKTVWGCKWCGQVDVHAQFIRHSAGCMVYRLQDQCNKGKTVHDGCYKCGGYMSSNGDCHDCGADVS